MTRVLSLLATLCLFTTGSAAPDAARDKPAQERPAQQTEQPPDRRGKEIAPNEAAEYVLTPATQVELDHRPAAYDAVPDNAIIVRMEVDEDERTILKIVFRSR